jgi:hypothetical protein
MTRLIDLAGPGEFLRCRLRLPGIGVSSLISGMALAESSGRLQS